MSEPIVYRYKPRDGEFITGIPQRDLTASDVANVPSWDLRNGVASGLYQSVEAPATEPAAEPETQEVTEPVAETEPENRRARR